MRSRAKKPPIPPWRSLSAPTMRASGPSSARTWANAASRVGASNRRVVKVHDSDRLELQLGSQLGVGEHGKAGGDRAGQPVDGGTDLGGAHERGRLAPLLG